ncbi:proline-rich protein [Mycena leptocephala]|nr:proline-rich protein [Mycena leptocephala]
MPSFAEMRDKAGKAKNATVTSLQNTKDRHSSVPLKTTNWDPYAKNQPPPPPPRANKFSRPVVQPSFLPPPQRGGAAAESPSSSTPPSPAPGPPPIVRATRPSVPRRLRPRNRLPPSERLFHDFDSRSQSRGGETGTCSASQAIRSTTAEQEIDWANLSPEDKEVFFAWLDEFFSRYLGKPIPAL